MSLALRPHYDKEITFQVQESQLNEAIKCLSSYFKIFNEDHQRVIESQKVSSPASPLPSMILF